MDEVEARPATMSHQSLIAIATKRLLEKQGNVREQLGDVSSRLESLQKLGNDCDSAVEEAEARVESSFATLASALDRRKDELLHSLRQRSAEKKATLAEHQRTCQEAIGKANAVGDIM